MRPRWSLRWTLGCLLGAVLLMQAVPYGRNHSNPRPTREARWTDPRAQALFRSSCGDCHSDHTRWYWYTNIAPGSWLAQSDVDGGRGAMNTSRWDRPQPDLGDLVEQVSGGEMPPTQYTLIHPGARLSGAEKRALVAGLRRLYATSPPVATRRGG